MSKKDNNQINEAIDLMIESGVDLKTVLDKTGTPTPDNPPEPIEELLQGQQGVIN